MFRIGHAWDVHQLVEGRDLFLGGLKIEGYSVGLLGHSDADVVLHSVAESLLGSLALGDLGTFFPDTDPKYKGMDSKLILRKCYQMILDNNYTLGNLDITIYAENVKINKVRIEMIDSISSILNVDKNKVSVKATTHEHMGFIGEGRAIASECVCLIIKRQPKKIFL